MREFSDDGGDYPVALWEGALIQALNGRRGQAFLKELEAEMLAMQARGEGRLLRAYLIADGAVEERRLGWGGETTEVKHPVGCCTLGVMAKKKATPEQLGDFLNRELEHPSSVACMKDQLGISRALIEEIGVMNDTGGQYDPKPETDEERFARMLKWVQSHISKNGEKVYR